MDGKASDPMADIALTILLDDLAWWSAALARARADGELAPAGRRARAAVPVRGD
ncbi:MAG: hypothetical protein ACRDY0_02650 [Acidimicrobiales bacterium]